jgi:CHAT domain-containing protein/Tfp pilus assembly protein PilF
MVRTILFLCVAVLIISIAAIDFAQQPSDKNNPAQPLELQKPINEQLKGGEARSYQLTVAAGQYVHLVVEQLGINIAVAVVDPKGKTVSDADGFTAGKPEHTSFIAELSGIYRFSVYAPDPNARSGQYRINLEELRAATEKDKSTVVAQNLSNEALALYQKHTEDSQRKAIDKYLQSTGYWHAAENFAGEAIALYMTANTFLDLGDKQKALEFANRAMVVAETAAASSDPDQRRKGIEAKAYALDIIGRVHVNFGDQMEALKFFNQALTVRREAKDRVGEAETLNNIATAYRSLGELPKAAEKLAEVRSIMTETGNRRDESIVLSNMCVINMDMGQNHKALELCNEALQISNELKYFDSQATILGNIGSVYSNLGNYQEALNFYNRSFALRKSLGQRTSQAVTLHNIAFIYGTLGDHEKALDFYNQALEIFRSIGNQLGEAKTLSNIGVDYAAQGEYQRALEIHLKVLAIRKSISDLTGEAITLNNIGGCYSNLNEKQKALDYYGQAIERHRKIGNQRDLAVSLKNIGTVYLDLGKQDEALKFFNEGLQVSRTIGDRYTEAGALSYIARVERDRGNLIEARKRIDEALNNFELLRASIKSQQLRAAFGVSFRKYFELDIDILMQLHKQQPDGGFDRAALEASEKSRARTLLELLAEAGAHIRQGVNLELVEREATLRQQIANKAENQIRLLSKTHTEAQASAVAKELDSLTTEYDQLLAQIRQTSPRYAALTQPLPLSLKEIQGQVLDEDTILLEYALGESRSYLWAITPESIRSFELSKRTDVETAARKLYELITESNRIVRNETPQQRQKRLEQADLQFPTAAAELSQMLLGPVASELKNKRLLIVGEGLLQYVPFAALTLPDKAASYTPLVVTHEIVTLPSASVLSVIRKEAAGRTRASKLVAVLADPVFDKQDPRLQGANQKVTPNDEAISLDDVKRSASESGVADFTRLRFSRQEAEEIGRFAPATKSMKALDFKASRPAALSNQLSDYQIIHFATHGLINNQHPDLSGLVLSLVNENGQAQNGFVRLYDIYNMNLNADLVVLSACQTALGKDIKGEGLVGLTRAFMYAGAPRVVASLWQIEDRATAQAMGRFYEGMLAKGLKPAAALREAQISMWKDRRWQAPRYWAGFTLQGEWK